jgi:hypothetical protein
MFLYIWTIVFMAMLSYVLGDWVWYLFPFV